MSDYIDRRKFEQLITERDLRTISTKTIGECLDKSPADVVEVVRCKDCKWWNGEQCLARKIEVVDVYDYCSYGERKNDERK